RTASLPLAYLPAIHVLQYFRMAGGRVYILNNHSNELAALPSPLPLWERSDCIARCNPGEGSRSIEDLNPSTAVAGATAPSPTRGEGKTASFAYSRFKFQTAKIIPAARIHPGCASIVRASSRKRAQGMPDAQCTRSLACKYRNKHASKVTTGPPESN